MQLCIEICSLIDVSYSISSCIICLIVVISLFCDVLKVRMSSLCITGYWTYLTDDQVHVGVREDGEGQGQDQKLKFCPFKDKLGPKPSTTSLMDLFFNSKRST